MVDNNDNHDDNTHHDYLEALERAMNEMDVLRAIYGGNEGDNSDDADDDDNDHKTDPQSSLFEIVSPEADELDRMRKALCDDEDGDVGRYHQRENFPDLQIQLRIPINDNDEDNDDRTATLRCSLPLGYPEHTPAVVTSVRLLPPLNRSLTDEISLALNKKAASLLGTEAIMDLVEETREILLSDRFTFTTNSSQSNSNNDPEDSACTHRVVPRCGRRLWIWVHHITSTDRRKSIVREARELNLTGILKHGYPGVVLAEGPGEACESFVGWIKGNKSRPGGFGRNWGHHVRGEIEFSLEDEDEDDDDDETNTAAGRTTAMTSFREMEELSEMAKSCREMGLDGEFKEFVMQHKK
eukprot:jgi/Psemu1/320478/estExt_fgenesh1_pm.C_5880004